MWVTCLHAAIEAMKNAHKEEMEKTHRSQLTGLNSDIDELRLQYEYVFAKIFNLINRVMRKEWLCCYREISSVASCSDAM